MPVPGYIVEKTAAKYPTKYCLAFSRIFPGLDVGRCEAGMATIVREKWAPGWEAGLTAFFKSLGAL